MNKDLMGDDMVRAIEYTIEEMGVEGASPEYVEAQGEWLIRLLAVQEQREAKLNRLEGAPF
jgi:hypothetical protein